MDHEPVLISTLAIGLSAAFVGGLIARRLRLPPIVGYLLAGVAVGPFTPGFIADAGVAAELAEIGVILLMFGVGLHFSIRDLLAVKGIAIPGAVGQSATATIFGTGLGLLFGWGIGGALVLGLALSVASTVVLLRALEERGELDTGQGRIAVGWLIVEDLFTVVVLVLLPAVAPLMGGTQGAEVSELGPLADLGIALVKAGIFAALMLGVGVRVVPWLLDQVAREGSRELFTLGVLGVALGIAFASSALFGVSLALGAFLAGAIVGESDLSHQAAADALPLRDAFAVLFFVSVGMLVDPAFLLAHPLEVLAVVVLVVVVKSIAAFGIVVALGYPLRSAITVAAALAQIGEFSFILATLGGQLELLPPEGFQLIVAGALISITLNPVAFAVVEPLDRRLRDQPAVTALLNRLARDLRRLDIEEPEAPSGHAILCGFGRVGRIIAGALDRRGFPYVVITTDRRVVEGLRREGKHALFGDASHRELLEEAGAARARLIIGAVNDPHVIRLMVDRARAFNPRIDVIARSHSDAEAATLRSATPAVQAVYGERELAVQMLRYALRRFGVSANEVELIAQGVRRRGGGPGGGAPERRPPLALPPRVRAAVARVRSRVGGSSRAGEPENEESPEAVVGAEPVERTTAVARRTVEGGVAGEL